MVSSALALQIMKPTLASDHEFKARPSRVPVWVLFQPHLVVWRAGISKAGVVAGGYHEVGEG